MAARKKASTTNIAGIDLGTTFSALAILNAIGKPEIAPNADGERLTPSAVYFDEDSAGTVRVGIEAVNSRHLNPQRSVRWIKRHMGDSDYSIKIDDQCWHSEQLSALILKKLKQDCLTPDADSRVVISVPAHFDEVRRKATMDAGSLAGLNVIGIINEPVAAALYYATAQSISGRVLVYDLGGGTFDVTIMNAGSQKIDIICSQGEHELGGIDFDKAVLDILQNRYKDKFNAELINNDEERARYEDEAEDIKKTLSRRDVARKMIYGSAGNMRVEVKRSEFEQAISPLIARTVMLIEVALEQASLKPSDVDRVLLVGGSTRIPMVQQQLEQMFGFAAESAVNVDECVALGAALHAGLTLQRQKPKLVPAGISGGLKSIQLTDVCNHSYGTICAPIDEETGKHVIENHIILKKNTSLPCQSSEVFYTMSKGQTELRVTVTQGEDSNVDYVNKIATHVLKLPEGRDAGCPIKVTYSYDVNQRMHCKFEDVESGEVLDVDFSLGRDGDIMKSVEVEDAGKLEAVKVE